jgi:hypothetical protein
MDAGKGLGGDSKGDAPTYPEGLPGSCGRAFEGGRVVVPPSRVCEVFGCAASVIRFPFPVAGSGHGNASYESGQPCASTFL